MQSHGFDKNFGFAKTVFAVPGGNFAQKKICKTRSSSNMSKNALLSASGCHMLVQVQWLEVGELGALILHAVRRVVEGRRREPDNAITQHLYMEVLCVQENPIK